jgi:glycosyltransferase involved in cell wall biosynthesis
MKKVDLVIPLYNESEAVPFLFQRLAQVFNTIDDYRYHFIFVNDGSKDDTLSRLESYCQSFPLSCKIISLSRNFGHQSAVGAGLMSSTGDAAVVIDADLQDPPEIIKEMIKKWESGFKIVYARRTRRHGESAFKLLSATLFYRFINFAANVDIPRDTGDFRLMDKVVVQSLNALPERNRFIRGLVPWLGFSHSFVEYEREERAVGVTKYPLPKMVKLAIDGISAFSTLPIRLCTYFGVTVIVASIVIALKIVFDRFFHPGYLITGWASVMVMILFFGGVQLLFLGIIGEYIGRIFNEVKGRPNFIIEKELNFEKINLPAN